MARALPSPQQAADRWQAGFSAAGQRWMDGVNAVQTAPGVAAAAAKDRYLAGVQQNANRWASQVASVTAQSWKEACAAKGQARLASGATVGAPKFASAIAKVLEAERSILSSLPPRGSVEQNIERSRQFQLAMHQSFRQGG